MCEYINTQACFYLCKGYVCLSVSACVSEILVSLCYYPFCVCAVVHLPDKWGIGGVTLRQKDREEDGWFCIHGKESGSRKLTGSQGVPCAIGGSPVVMTLWTVVMGTDLKRMPVEKHVDEFIQWNSIVCSADTCWLESTEQLWKNKRVCQHSQLSHTKLTQDKKTLQQGSSSLYFTFFFVSSLCSSSTD